MSAELELIGIECEKTAADVVDIVSLVVDADNHHMEEGRPIWGPQKMDEGDARIISWSWEFDDWITVKLYKHDRSSRLHIGTVTIRHSDPVGTIRNPYYFTGHGAVYKLFYRLRLGEEIGSDAEDAILMLRSLRCNDPQEATDKPYIVVNGVTQWGPAEMKNGDIVTLRNRTVPFNRTAHIELWERDPRISNMVGSRIVNFSDVGVSGESVDIPVQFNRGNSAPRNASYVLTYRVRRGGRHLR